MDGGLAFKSMAGAVSPLRDFSLDVGTGSIDWRGLLFRGLPKLGHSSNAVLLPDGDICVTLGDFADGAKLPWGLSPKCFYGLACALAANWSGHKSWQYVGRGNDYEFVRSTSLDLFDHPAGRFGNYSKYAVFPEFTLHDFGVSLSVVSRAISKDTAFVGASAYRGCFGRTLL